MLAAPLMAVHRGLGASEHRVKPACQPIIKQEKEKGTSDRGDESGRWQMAGEPRLGVIQGQTVTALPRKILDRYRLSLGEGAGTAHCMTACTRRVISSASS